MILKIKSNNGWVYFEGVTKIETSVEWVKSTEVVESSGEAYFHRSGIPVSGERGTGDGSERRIVRAMLTLNDEIFKREVVFDCEGFLLNNEGKTIERI